MCNLGEGIREKALAEGMQVLIETLKDFCSSFDEVYRAVTKHDIYKNVTEEQVRKYY